MWDAGQLPVLRVYGEFGATQEHPYRDRFYTLALRPSRNPYPRSTTIGIGEQCLTHFDYTADERLDISDAYCF